MINSVWTGRADEGDARASEMCERTNEAGACGDTYMLTEVFDVGRGCSWRNHGESHTRTDIS